MKTTVNTALVMLLFQAATSWAITPQTEQEIDQLLAFIGNSACQFERNGSTHTAIKARSHIELKYGNTRKYIDSTEDFIKYAATKSSFTGRPYMIRCNGKEQPTARWLLDELAHIRSNKAAAAEAITDAASH